MRTFKGALAVCAMAVAFPALADVSVTVGDVVRQGRRAGHSNAEKKVSRRPAATGRRALATGSIQLVDAAGLEYFINTNINFDTSSSASAAASEASYQNAVSATTSMGGNVMATLDDMFDGYNSACVNIGGAGALPCTTGNAAWAIYNRTGAAATLDATCANRQANFPVQTIGGLQVSRKVYVPNTDTFARWLNIFTNPTGAPITIRFATANNLGSDSNTRIVTTSSGDAVATTADLWVTTFQNYAGTTSSDPRIGHILQGPGAIAAPLSVINFADGDDNPYWAYNLTIPPGATRVVMNFVTGQPSKAAAAAKAASLTGTVLPSAATACMTALELGGVVNFAGAGLGAAPIPSLSTAGLLVLGAALALSAAAILRKSLL